MSRAPSAREKARLRREVLEKRGALSEAARHAASRSILDMLAGLPEFRAARGVHCFISLAEEVDTAGIFEACWEAGKATFVPYQLEEEGRLGWARRNPEHDLVGGPFNVPEPTPENRRPVPLEEIDLVLAPGVAFDRRGNRLGYGKGYYDDFLTQIGVDGVHGTENMRRFSGKRPVVIGLAFAAQIVPSVPREPWDVQVDAIITEQELIRPV